MFIADTNLGEELVGTVGEQTLNVPPPTYTALAVVPLHKSYEYVPPGALNVTAHR